jgi:hypothetical protein
MALLFDVNGPNANAISAHNVWALRRATCCEPARSPKHKQLRTQRSVNSNQSQKWKQAQLLTTVAPLGEPQTLSTPVENLTVPPGENLTDRRGDEPQVVVAS